jgi:hypothetical protein
MEKYRERIWEIIGAAAVIASFISRTVFHRKDYDLVFDKGGKITIIVLFILFLGIYYLQSKRNDKGEG